MRSGAAMHMQEDKIAKKNSMAGRWSIDGPCMDILHKAFWARAMKRWELAWVPKNYGRRTYALKHTAAMRTLRLLLTDHGTNYVVKF